jgi:hypothetical protein
MKICKYFLIFLILPAMAFIISCGKDDTITNPPPVSGPFTLSGTISGYPGGSIIAKAKITKSLPVPDSFFVGTDTIDNNAQLSMVLATPPTDFLVQIAVPPGITVSDTSARISLFSVLRGYNFSNELIAVIQKRILMTLLYRAHLLFSFFFHQRRWLLQALTLQLLFPIQILQITI